MRLIVDRLQLKK